MGARASESQRMKNGERGEGKASVTTDNSPKHFANKRYLNDLNVPTCSKYIRFFKYKFILIIHREH